MNVTKTKKRPSTDSTGAGTAATEAEELSPREVKLLFESSGYSLVDHPAHAIRRAHQRATTCFQEVVKQKNLTPTQMAALATIMKYGELSQNRLGRLTAMDPSTISIVIRKLLRLGLVARSGAAHDQRLSIIRLTNEGVRFTLPLLNKSIEVGDRVLAPLTPDEQRVFMELLYKVAGPPNAQ